jgi:hypothetical protein
MDEFVCVRMVQGWGMDLSIFQFDWRATWIVFLMNADRAVYGRYGARQSNDLQGLARALEGALDLHKKFPANKEELAGKVGPALPWKKAEDLPGIREKGKFGEAESKKGCVHCHNVQEGLTKSYRSLGQSAPQRILAGWPGPERMGVALQAGERAAVTEVQRGTPAEKAGLQAGDRIVRFGGQPILSITDVEWVLWSGPDQGDLRIEVDRGGRKVEAVVSLPSGWRD